MADRLLKLAQVMDIVGLGRSMIYRLIRNGEFPRPFKPGGYSSRWSESEVRAWCDQLKAERDARQMGAPNGGTEDAAEK